MEPIEKRKPVLIQEVKLFDCDLETFFALIQDSCGVASEISAEFGLRIEFQGNRSEIGSKTIMTHGANKIVSELIEMQDEEHRKVIINNYCRSEIQNFKLRHVFSVFQDSSAGKTVLGKNIIMKFCSPSPKPSIFSEIVQKRMVANHIYDFFDKTIEKMNKEKTVNYSLVVNKGSKTVFHRVSAFEEYVKVGLADKVMIDGEGKAKIITVIWDYAEKISFLANKTAGNQLVLDFIERNGKKIKRKDTVRVIDLGSKMSFLEYNCVISNLKATKTAVLQANLRNHCRNLKKLIELDK